MVVRFGFHEKLRKRICYHTYKNNFVWTRRWLLSICNTPCPRPSGYDFFHAYTPLRPKLVTFDFLCSYNLFHDRPRFVISFLDICFLPISPTICCSYASVVPPSMFLLWFRPYKQHQSLAKRRTQNTTTCRPTYSKSPFISIRLSDFNFTLYLCSNVYQFFFLIIQSRFVFSVCI